jgi:homoserine kinase
VKAAGLDAGALGGGISGSGPSMFFLSKNKEIAESVVSVIRGVYEETGIQFNTYVSQINPRGVQCV